MLKDRRPAEAHRRAQAAHAPVFGGVENLCVARYRADLFQYVDEQSLDSGERVVASGQPIRGDDVTSWIDRCPVVRAAERAQSVRWQSHRRWQTLECRPDVSERKTRPDREQLPHG